MSRDDAGALEEDLAARNRAAIDVGLGQGPSGLDVHIDAPVAVVSWIVVKVAPVTVVVVAVPAVAVPFVQQSVAPDSTRVRLAQAHVHPADGDDRGEQLEHQEQGNDQARHDPLVGAGTSAVKADGRFPGRHSVSGIVSKSASSFSRTPGETSRWRRVRSRSTSSAVGIQVPWA